MSQYSLHIYSHGGIGPWFLHKGSDSVLSYTVEHMDCGEVVPARGETVGEVFQPKNLDKKDPEDAKHCALLFQMFKTACRDLSQDRHDVHDISVLEKSLAENLEVNLTGPWGETLLHIAAKYGRLDAMRILLKRGADIHAKTSVWQKTPEDYLKARLVDCNKYVKRCQRLKVASKDRLGFDFWRKEERFGRDNADATAAMVDKMRGR